MSQSLRAAAANPIKFGTDGWRGVIAADFTIERVARVAPLAAEALAQEFGASTGSRTILVGYDRRFMAEDFARVAAEAIQAIGYRVKLSDCYAPTPVFSWIAHHEQALGAIVLTASHNPGRYLGLKVKGAFGGSVSPEVTQKIETMLAAETVPAEVEHLEPIESFNPWESGYCEALRQFVDLAAIRAAIADGKLAVFVDAMHGASAGGLSKVLDVAVQELNTNRDPLFEGGAPEPLPKYTTRSIAQIRDHQQAHPDQLAVGLVFDGDCDRIAAIDGSGEFLTSQILIPILIQHLAVVRGQTGEVVKTVSGSDLMPKVAELYQLPVHETAVGYKYIADRMLSVPVLIGGEESGGVGYGNHIPERDALLSALYVLEAVVKAGKSLNELYGDLQTKTNFFNAYDRIDLALASMAARDQLLGQLQTNPPQMIAGQAVTDCQTTDGYKFRLTSGDWLMVRFSGTEPVLRLYCEAVTLDRVHEILEWARQWAEAAAA